MNQGPLNQGPASTDGSHSLEKWFRDTSHRFARLQEHRCGRPLQVLFIET